MTATQVFLRFMKSEYTNSNGTIDANKYKLWRKIFRRNYISCKYEYSCSKYVTKLKSKNFVDDYLSYNRYTLAGFGGHFFDNSPIQSLFFRMYGWNLKMCRSRFIGKWRGFISAHIEGKTNSIGKKNTYYTYSWKE